MAKDTSRKWQLSDADLLTHFNTHFLQPLPWIGCTLRSEMSSAVISMLHKQWSTPELWTAANGKQLLTGNCGFSSVQSSPWIPHSPREKTPSHTYRSLHTGTALDASHPVASPCSLAQFLMPYEVLGRHAGGWGPQTSD